MSQETETYVVVLVDALKRKNRSLKQILELTTTQEEALGKEEIDVEAFQSVFEEKGKLIQEVLELDEGFDSIYKKISDDLIKKKDVYKKSIQQMQVLISEITDTSTKIKALENQNNDKFKMFLATEKGKIKKFKISRNIASNYYQNMTNSPRKNESYFFDKKK